jgi:hypothetical protein
MTAAGGYSLEVLFPYFTGNLLKLTNRQTVQLVGMRYFTKVHASLPFGLKTGFYLFNFKGFDGSK